MTETRRVWSFVLSLAFVVSLIAVWLLNDSEHIHFSFVVLFLYILLAAFVGWRIRRLRRRGEE